MAPTAQSLPGIAPPPASSTALALLPSTTTNFTLLDQEFGGGSWMNQTVYAVYGKPAPFSLLPCASASQLMSKVICAAAAAKLIANGSVVDISQDIAVQDISVNVSARWAVQPRYINGIIFHGCNSVTIRNDSFAFRCGASALSVGNCLPGRYQLLYSIGNIKAALTVNVEQLSTSSFNYR